MAASYLHAFRWLWCALGALILSVAVRPMASHAGDAACSARALPTPSQRVTTRTAPADSASWTVERADQYVRDVFRNGTTASYAKAASAYMHLITAPRAALSPDERAIVQRHRHQLALVLPDSLRARIPADAGDAQLDRDLGVWWRAQDPLPASAKNERVITHLQRVAHATEAYASDQSAAGVDPRGEVYIRLGPPARTTTVRFNASRVLTIIRTSPTLTRGDFPDNEYWVYPHVDAHAKYLFVKTGGGRWRVGTALDLVPRFFRVGLGTSDRGRQRARDLGTLLEEVYSQLGTVDVDYGPWYQEAADATAASLSGSITSRMRQVVAQGREYEAQQAFDRARSVPRTAAATVEDAEELPVDVRVARFLEADGTTRTEVYWAPRPGALFVPDRADDYPGYDTWDRYLLVFAAVPQDTAFTRQAVHYKRYLFSKPAQGRATIGANEYAVTGNTGQYHLRLQWQQHIARQADTRDIAVGPRVKVQAVRFDSLMALHAAPDVLEMSDLKPLLADNASQLEEATPYPHASWNARAELVLYFEVYHLARNAAGETEYSVAYEIQRTTRRGGLRGWFGGTEEDQTSASTTYTGTARKTEEYIVLDLDDGLSRTEGAVQITVRVTDETTGARVERALSLKLTETDSNS